MDNNEFYYPNGQLKSPSKMLVEAAAAKGDVAPVGAHTAKPTADPPLSIAVLKKK